METFTNERLRPHCFGIVLCLLALVFGFGLGGAFGAAEDSIKDHLAGEAQAVLAEKYDGQESKTRAVLTKSWSYLKRAHLHAGGLGAACLVQILLLALLRPAAGVVRLASVLLGLGALLYPLFWMLAALRAPGLGSTGAAKDSLEWLAIPGAGCVIVGTLATVCFTIVGLRGKAAA